MHFPMKLKIWIIPISLVLIAVACAFPGGSRPTEVLPPMAADSSPEVDSPLEESTQPPPPTPTRVSLPPALVAVDPPLGADFPLQGPLTLYFNQPMDKPSVEISLTGQPSLSGHFEWENDSTVTFEPDQPYLPGNDLEIVINTTALAMNGLFLQEPVRLSYRVVPALIAIKVMPEPGLVDIDPDSAVVVTFNQPVVPVGTDSAVLPDAFTIDPAVPGRGEWVNTSSYIFYPDTALAGGVEYTVLLNSDLSSISGAPFEGMETYQIRPFEWTFKTTPPRLVSVFPVNGADSVPLDTVFKVEFSQAMDPISVESNFSLLETNRQAISGEFGWSDDFKTMVFTPTSYLARDVYYDLVLLGPSQSRGGTPLGFDTVSRIGTVPALKIAATEPVMGGVKSQYTNLVLHFNGPAEVKNPLDYFSFSPKVSNLTHWWDEEGESLSIHGDFSPLSAYTATISGTYPDPWGGDLGDTYKFKFSTAALEPNFIVSTGETSLFVTPSDASITAQATNIGKIGLRLGSVTFEDLIHFTSEAGYEQFKKYTPEDQLSWTYRADLSGDQNHTLRIPVSREGTGLEPGIYRLGFFVSELTQQPQPHLLISSNVHLSLKMSTTSAFAWAVDLRTLQPVVGVPVAIFDTYGNRLTSGVTDAMGVFQSPISVQPDLFPTYYAVMSEPGDEYFSVSLSNWGQGIEAYDFGVNTDFIAPHLVAYLYTERPIYQPGQKGYYRGILRHKHNGRYALPDQDTLEITVYDNNDTPIFTFEPQVSKFGTVHGSFLIPQDAQPGQYQIATAYGNVSFQVAEYQVPGIDLSVEMQNSLAAGQSIVAKVHTRYYFGSSAGDVPFTWRIYRRSMKFHLPGYQVGTDDFWWQGQTQQAYPNPFGEFLSSGESSTESDGRFMITIPTDDQISNPSVYTLEITLKDDNESPVRVHSQIMVHPGDYYIGIRPDTWVGQAGMEIAFDVKGVDWNLEPAGVQEMEAHFRKVVWLREDSSDPYDEPGFSPQVKSVASTDFFISSEGLARLAYTPPEPGIYQLDVKGNGTQTRVFVWVGGSGDVLWPNLPNNQLQVTTDKGRYQPGDTAIIFIPNPFENNTQVLVTFERDEILYHDVFTLDGTGSYYSFTVSDREAPNCYVSATLIGQGIDGRPDFRQGYLNLLVDPVNHTLDISLDMIGASLEPGGEVTYNLAVQDSQGKPVQGEFSIAVVNQQVFDLLDPNAMDILSPFYGQQPLGVRTGMSLAVYAHREMALQAGIGGGADQAAAAMIGQEYPDTAYWNAEITTDDLGNAEIEIPLPDILTTWDVNVLGLTADTQVGDARAEIHVAKDLLVEPVTPRFFVVGDHAEVAALVYNNSKDDLQVEISINSPDFSIDKPQTDIQEHQIPAGGKLRVSWSGTVEDVPSLDIIFSASGGGYFDTARPVTGAIPVIRYSAYQTFRAAGILDLEEDRLEIISLPPTFDAVGGALQIEASPSLAAAMTTGLDVLERNPYPGTEYALSRFLPNLIVYRTIQDLGLESPDLLARLERTLDVGMRNLMTLQNLDGGWDWWPGEKGAGIAGEEDHPHSNTYLTAYVVFGLSRVKDAGVFVDERMLQNGIEYLQDARPVLETLSSAWQLDQLAFHYFSLSQAGVGSAGAGRNLFEVRDQLSPYATAFLALTLSSYDADDERIDTLLADLEGDSIYTAKGVHWEGAGHKTNLDTPVYNTAVAVYTLAQLDPASFLLPEAVRYLMSNRQADGTWGSTYETAWTILALTHVMKGTGELAGDFSFSAVLNESPLISGKAGGDARLNPVSALVPIGNLYPDSPNSLLIQRTSGPGRLYYTAHLEVVQPAQDAVPLSHGVNVSREYSPSNDDVISGTIGSLVTVKVNLVLEADAYYLVLEDYIPAGAEILDTSLKTNQAGADIVDPRHPFKDGWGWWYFNDPQIHVDHITWTTDYIPAGTYELSYILALIHPGKYQVLPAQAWEYYFPEVHGSSSGDLFIID